MSNINPETVTWTVWRSRNRSGDRATETSNLDFDIDRNIMYEDDSLICNSAYKEIEHMSSALANLHCGFRNMQSHSQKQNYFWNQNEPLTLRDTVMSSSDCFDTASDESKQYFKKFKKSHKLRTPEKPCQDFDIGSGYLERGDGMVPKKIKVDNLKKSLKEVEMESRPKYSLFAGQRNLGEVERECKTKSCQSVAQESVFEQSPSFEQQTVEKVEMESTVEIKRDLRRKCRND